MNREEYKYDIRRADFSDLDEITAVIDEGRRAIAELGIDQWQNGFPPRELICEDIEKGRCVVALKDGKIAATAAFVRGVDPTYVEIFDGAWLTDGEYLAVHRVAASDAFRGKGASRALIEEAFAEAEKIGVGSVRIDTHPGNLRMRRFLSKLGFTECGIILLPEEEALTRERVAFERVIKSRTAF